MKFKSYYGVDFSGAREAGRNIWVARARPGGRARLRLVELSSLEQLCGSCERGPALKHLVRAIATSEGALWAMDLPFGLPVEIFDDGTRWADQLQLVREWSGEAHGLGLWCCERANRLGGQMHLRRTTDTDARTPFDGYHYRIIYQTFHGMRDVLSPLSRTRGTAILPFQYGKLARAERVVVEACPGSTLKRWGVPHQNYKQPAGGPLTSLRRRTRHAILAAVSSRVEISDRHRRTIMRNGGGDALDAVIAAAGAFECFHSADHAGIANHARYPLEGYLFV